MLLSRGANAFGYRFVESDAGALNLDLNFVTGTYTDGGSPIALADYFESNPDHLGPWNPGVTLVNGVGWQVTNTVAGSTVDSMDMQAAKLVQLFDSSGFSCVIEGSSTGPDNHSNGAQLGIYADNLPDWDSGWAIYGRLNGYVGGLGLLREVHTVALAETTVVSERLSGVGPVDWKFAMSFDNDFQKLSFNGSSVFSSAQAVGWVVSALGFSINASSDDDVTTSTTVTRIRIMPKVADADLVTLSA